MPVGGSKRILSGATPGRSEGSRTGQKEKLSYDEVTTKASDNPTGSSRAGPSKLSQVKTRSLGLCTLT